MGLRGDLKRAYGGGLKVFAMRYSQEFLWYILKGSHKVSIRSHIRRPIRSGLSIGILKGDH